MSRTPKKLTLELSDEQLKALKPLIDATGSIKIAGDISGSTLKVSHLACGLPPSVGPV